MRQSIPPIPLALRASSLSNIRMRGHNHLAEHGPRQQPCSGVGKIHDKLKECAEGKSSIATEPVTGEARPLIERDCAQAIDLRRRHWDLWYATPLPDRRLLTFPPCMTCGRPAVGTFPDHSPRYGHYHKAPITRPTPAAYQGDSL